MNIDEPFPKSGVYSQNNEDFVISILFGDYVGTFLDIGAADGVELSNTRLFAERGWSGLMVEPHPTNYKRLVENCREFPLVSTMNRAVRAEGCTGNLYLQKGDKYLWWSTGHDVQYQSEKKCGVRKFDVVDNYEYIGVDELYSDGQAYDFVSIDTDGFDFEIMKKICQIHKPKVFCAEVCDYDATLDQWIDGFGDYRMVLRTRENIIMELI